MALEKLCVERIHTGVSASSNRSSRSSSSSSDTDTSAPSIESARASPVSDSSTYNGEPHEVPDRVTPPPSADRAYILQSTSPASPSTPSTGSPGSGHGPQGTATGWSGGYPPPPGPVPWPYYANVPPPGMFHYGGPVQAGGYMYGCGCGGWCHPVLVGCAPGCRVVHEEGCSKGAAEKSAEAGTGMTKSLSY